MRKASPDRVCEEALEWARSLPPVRHGPGCTVCSLPADVRAGLDAIRSYGPKIGSQYLATKGYKILAGTVGRHYNLEHS